MFTKEVGETGGKRGTTVGGRRLSSPDDPWTGLCSWTHEAVRSSSHSLALKMKPVRDSLAVAAAVSKPDGEGASVILKAETDNWCPRRQPGAGSWPEAANSDGPHALVHLDLWFYRWEKPASQPLQWKQWITSYQRVYVTLRQRLTFHLFIVLNTLMALFSCAAKLCIEPQPRLNSDLPTRALHTYHNHAQSHDQTHS